MIAIGLDAVGGLGLETEAQGGQSDRQRIGEIVAGVGNQRQAAGANPGKQLNHDKTEGSRRTTTLEFVQFRDGDGGAKLFPVLLF